jgi:protein phosphatase 2C family protein 2/3
MGIVKAYGVNTYQGIVRNYNEDRVSIIINMNKPKNYQKKKIGRKYLFLVFMMGTGEKDVLNI